MNDDTNFEEPLVKVRRRIEELAAMPDDAAHRREIEKLQVRLERLSREIYGNLNPWQKTLVALPGRKPWWPGTPTAPTCSTTSPLC